MQKRKLRPTESLFEYFLAMREIASKAQFFKKRRQLHKYKKHESVRTQYGTQLKLRSKFCEPYLIKTVKPHDRYEVEKVGQHEGPHLTSTAVDFMKRWSTADA
ncbi:hypothetical protein TNCV_4728191 [Trichonephila clavipes]|nr:hypothetical protein TNCV_4728191 [Trichonephila clavipes]